MSEKICIDVYVDKSILDNCSIDVEINLFDNKNNQIMETVLENDNNSEIDLSVKNMQVDDDFWNKVLNM